MENIVENQQEPVKEQEGRLNIAIKSALMIFIRKKTQLEEKDGGRLQEKEKNSAKKT